ncbi:MAG: UTP--glucose-1-phosphate uridylyltransferase, partial [Ignavibacteriae bacterium]|nr:UTP--glucose-1-phosphate uridylyltransferase [Ignavibacteriota bacterium]
NIKKHKFFNTNNIWVNLKSLKKILEDNNNILGLQMIVNKKTVDPRNHNSESVFQLETAMGSAISVFKGASALAVPRSRFAPVKTTEDLLAVKSDNYILTEDYNVIVNPKRKLKPLHLKLDHKYYKHVDQIEERIPYPLSLIECEELSISGDYKFGKNIKLKGKIHLTNTSDKQIVIEDNTILKG